MLHYMFKLLMCINVFKLQVLMSQLLQRYLLARENKLITGPITSDDLELVKDEVVINMTSVIF